MAFKVITPPDLDALIPVATLLKHVKDESADADRQAEVKRFRDAAHAAAQHYCNCAFGSQTLEMALDAFPCDGVELERIPATSIVSVKYLDTTGAQQTLDPSRYTLDDYNSQRHWLLPTYDTDWPDTIDSPNAVKVLYQAGAAALPSSVQAAILLMVGHLDQNREAVAVGLSGAVELPLGVKALLDTEKVWVL